MKELKISKMLCMSFFAPLVFIIIYIVSLQSKEFVPPLFLFTLISLFVLVPVEIITLLKNNKEENGKKGIKCALVYTQKLNIGKAVLIVFILFCIAGIASKFIGDLENSLVMPIVNKYVPDYFMAENFVNQLTMYSKSIIIVTTILFVIANSIVLPITEELYFNGYMLPRIQRFKGFAPLIVTVVFSIYHFWSPWQNIRRIIGVFPYVYMVNKKKNIYIGIAVHCLCNFIGSIEIIMMVLKAIG